jgi:hypothetical protein
MTVTPPPGGTQFDGVSGYAEIPDMPSLGLAAANAFTVAFWVRLDQIGNNPLPRFFEKDSEFLCVMGDPTNGEYGHIGLEVQNATGTSNSNGGASEFWGSTKLRTNVWYHIVVTFNGNLRAHQARFFVNGRSERMRALYPWTGRIYPDAGRSLYLARRHQDLGYNLHGTIAAFSLYTRPLTPAQALRLYEGASVPGAAVSYTMNAGPGATLSDQSGHRDDGLLSGGWTARR